MNRRQLEAQKAHADDEMRVIRQLKQVYAQARKDCETKIRALSGRTDMENLQSIIWQKQYQEALKAQIDGILDILNANSFQTIAEYLGECYENGFFGTLYDLQGQGIPLIFPINQEEVAEALQVDSKISQGYYQRLGEDTSVLKKSIRAELSRGIVNGESWNQIAVHIANGMNSPFNKAFNNALRIARTEGHRVQQEATWHCQQRAKSKGADVLKQWDSTLDSATRPHHVELDGQVRELEELFEVAGHMAMYPGGFGIASEDIHCRCVSLQRARWALSEEEFYDKWNGDKNELVRVKAKTYNEFKKNIKQVFTKQQNSEIRLGELENAYGKKHSKNLTKLLESAPYEARSLWDECVDEFHCIEPKYRGEKAFYSPSHDGVKLSISRAAKGSAYQMPYQVVFHEYGHHSDYIMNRRYGTGKEKKSFSESYKDGIFGKTLKQEANKAIENFAKERFGGKEADEVITDVIIREFCEHIKEELTIIQRADISDMFEPVMPKECAYPFGVGHGTSYWRNRDNGKEGFAEMYSAMVTNPESLEQIKRFFPESFKIFLEMLGVIE